MGGRRNFGVTFVDFVKVAILCQYELECLENCKI